MPEVRHYAPSLATRREVYFKLLTLDGDPATGLVPFASGDIQIWQPSVGVWVDVDNLATITELGRGWYLLILGQSEMADRAILLDFTDQAGAAFSTDGVLLKTGKTGEANALFNGQD